MRLSLFIPALLILTSAGYAAPRQDAMPAEITAKPAKPLGPVAPLRISYNGRAEEWTLATLAKLPHKTIQVYNEHAKATQNYSGVPLADLLTRIGIPTAPRGKEMRLYLVAQGVDGYLVTFSLAEVLPNFRSGDILVADALEGKPIPETGPLQLVVSEDKRPARWVHSIVEIRVLTAE
ncbi:molybdopterin-dependent oxidoreductase [Acidicapsa ligni]|uniref:molybdopterin-dependent oxidoreductase n=1 Tax=Acidicapsa ligni TaxID=542300 RepID=UPI0021DF82AB|nr:molybdopterin-dependent oxidoreductase [Acidicapsa ligni]